MTESASAPSTDQVADGQDVDGLLVPRVDVSQVPVDVARLTGAVSADRIEEMVGRIAVGPRHVVEDHEQALEAAGFVGESLLGMGLEVASAPVDGQGVSLPAIWAEIGGSQTDTVFVFAAHYDTVSASPGADDNASGVAGLLEIARVLKDNPLPSTVVLAALPFEETGAFEGSIALATALNAKSQITGMISIEMIGFTSPEEGYLLPGPADFLAIVGNTESAPLIHTFHSAAALWLPQRRLAPIAMDARENHHLGRSDHAPFWAIGVPGAMATDTADFRNANYHEPTDTPDTLDYEFARDCVQALLLGAHAYTSLCAASGVPVVI